MELVQFLLSHSSTFFFVLIRTGAILMTAPIFGAVNVPMQVKMGLTFVTALILAPLMPFVAMPASVTGLVLNIAGELFIGAAIGLCIRFIFIGIEFAGQIASFQMGIGMASAYDPINSMQSTVLGKLMSIFSLLIFLSLNGHLMIIMALKKSFDVIPPYGFHISGALMDGILAFSREIFVLALKFSAPVVAVLVFINIGFGIMARTVPQLNMFVIGFAVTIAAGFIVMAFSLPAFGSALVKAYEQMWEGVSALMKVM